jgi:uncharacterized protein YceH (UPF0502 family)
MESATAAAGNEQAAPKWKPLPKIHRRILGVLVEKAKTTPNGYPLSLNALATGSNQKSNRAPQMDLTPDDIEVALEELRTWGATGEVHGDGRVVKYRHYLKEWLGVDGTELAVMAELLLRGAQTVGELRGRAARMAGSALPDVTALRPVLSSLIDKGLVISLTPVGRGQVVTHALFLEAELDKVQAEFGSSSGDAPASSSPVRGHQSTPITPAPAANPPATQTTSEDSDLRTEVGQLRAELARLRKEIEDIWANINQ